MAAAAAAAGGGSGSGIAGSRKSAAASRDAEAEVWCRRVREVVSADPANRLCFECGQRGVTYVDISVGSLVCTGCSGALRGLNPPHRVKSISMTTFTEAEVLFLQARGNEACRRVWLGTFDPRGGGLLPDSRDPQKVKEFLQEKYEKKRWYVAPDQAKPPQTGAGGEPAPAQPPLGEGGPLLPPRPPPTRAPPQPARKTSTDLLADIGGDPFAAPQPAPNFPGPAPPRLAFPNFDAFGTGPGAPAFGGAAPPRSAPPAPTGGHSLFGTLRPPPPPYGGYTNPFTPPRPSTNPFQSDGASFAPPPVPGGFPSPFQPDGSPFGGFSVAKASTNPFVTIPAPSTGPFGIKHPTTNPFL